MQFDSKEKPISTVKPGNSVHAREPVNASVSDITTGFRLVFRNLDPEIMRKNPDLFSGDYLHILKRIQKTKNSISL